MSLERVADAAGIDVSHLSRVERGQASLSVDSLARLARALGLTELAKLLAPYARAGRPGAKGARRSLALSAGRGGGGEAA